MKKLFLVLTVGLIICSSIYARDDPFAGWEHDAEWVTLSNHLASCYQGIVERCEALKYHYVYYGRRQEMRYVIAPPEPPTFIWPVYDYIRFAKKIDELAPHYIRHELADADGSFETYFSDGELDPPMWDSESLHAAAGFSSWSTNMLLHSWALTDHSIQKEVSDALNMLRWSKARHQRWIAGTDGELTGNHGAPDVRGSFVDGTLTSGQGSDTNRASSISKAVLSASTVAVSDTDMSLKYRGISRGTEIFINGTTGEYQSSVEIVDGKLHLSSIDAGISDLTVIAYGWVSVYGENNDQGTGWQDYRDLPLGRVTLTGQSDYTFGDTVLGNLGTSVDDMYWGTGLDDVHWGSMATIWQTGLKLWYQWEPDSLCDELHWNLISPRTSDWGVDIWRNADVGLMSADSRDDKFPEMYSIGEVRGLVPGWVEFHSIRSRSSVDYLYTNAGHQVDFYARAQAYGAGDTSFHTEYDDCGTGLFDGLLTRFNVSESTTDSNVVSEVLGRVERAPLWSETVHCPYDVYMHSRGFRVDQAVAVVKWSFDEVESLKQDIVEISPDVNRDGLLDIGTVPDTLDLRTGFVSLSPDDPAPMIYIPLVVTPEWYRGLRVNTFWCQGAFTELPYHHLSHNQERTDYHPSYCYDDDGPYQSFSLNTRIMESSFVNNDEQQEKKVSLLRPHGTLVVFNFPWNAAEGAFETRGYPMGVNSNRTYVIIDITPEDHQDFNYELMFESGISHIYGAARYSSSWGSGDGWLKKVVNKAVPELRWADCDWYNPEVYMPEYIPGGEIRWVNSGFLNLPKAQDAQFKTLWTWSEGLIDKFTLTSVPDSSKVIEVIPTYDEEGRITGLSKTGAEGIEQSNFSIAALADGARVDYAWGSISSASTAPAGGARDVVLTKTITGVGSTVDTFSFDSLERLTLHNLNANGQTASTSYDYYENAGRFANGARKSAKLKTVTRFDGGQSQYEYDPDTGWLTTESSVVGNGSVKSTRYSYASSETSGDLEDRSLFIERPRKVESYLDSTCIARSLFAYTGIALIERQTCRSDGAAWNDTNNIVTVSSYDESFDDYDPLLYLGMTKSSETPLGTNTYAYNAYAGELQTTATLSDGRTIRVTQGGSGVPLNVRTEEEGCTIQNASTTADEWGRPLKTTDHLAGTYTENQNYTFFGPQTVRDTDGSVSTIEYYNTGMPKSRTDGATGIKTEWIYDVLGNITETETTGTGGETVVTKAAYDALGRQTYALNSYGGETTTAYSLISSTGNRSVTTLPTGGVVQKDVFFDGSLREVSGSGAHSHIRKKYGIKDGSFCETTIAVGDDGGETEWTETYFNMLGQAFKTKHPSDDGTAVESVNLFDSKTRAVGHIDENNLTTLRHFNDKHEVSDAGLHVDGAPGVLTPASSDRYRSFDRAVTPEGVIRQTFVRPLAGFGTAEVLSLSERALDGKSWSSTYAGRTTSGERSNYEPGGKYEITSQSSDGTRTIRKYDKWRLARMEKYDRNYRLIEFEQRSYNGLGALRQVSHSREGITTYQYDSRNRLSSIIPSDPSKGMTFISYEPGTSIRSSVTRTDGRQIFYDYWPNGRLKREYGAGEDVSYEYDSQGRKARMVTLRQGDPVATEWKYNRYTGQLDEKLIAAQKVEDYQYRANGQVKAVTDAEGVASICSYGPAGDLEEIITSDGNSRTINSFDRMGHIVGTAEEGGIGESYVKTLDGLISSIAVAGSGIVSNSSIQYARGSDAAEVRQIDWAVDGTASGRVEVARDSFMRVTNVGMGSITATYSYPTNGTMTTRLSIKQDGREVISRSTGWDFTNNRINSIEYAADAVTAGSFYYAFETNSDRIVSILRSDGTYWEYGYDRTNRLTSGVLYGADGAPVPGMGFGYAYDEIGNITAKGLTGDDGRPWHTFESSDRNAHVVRHWADKLDLRGEANTNVLVAVNMVEAERAGKDFFVPVPVERRDAAVWTNLTVMAVERNQAGDIVAVETGRLYIASADEVVEHRLTGMRSADSRFAYEWDRKGRLISATSEGKGVKVEFSYYPDGRRATKTVHQKNADGGQWELDRKHEYYYDGWNVIAEIQVSGFRSQVSVTNVTRYLWGLDIAEQADSARVAKSSPGATAGGIGGLLAIQQVSGSETSTCVTVSDHQGSIHKVIDADTGQIVEEYTYSPFGEVLTFRSQASGLRSSPICAFAYQSKYLDAETGLYYYGYRYYDPSSGKWLSPDPKGESGGINLYAFCSNDPVNGVDYLGLAAYFFGGTGNSQDEGHMTNVEILYEAWQENAGHGKGYYVPGVFSGKAPSGDDYLLWKLRVGEALAQGSRGATLGKRVDEMMSHLDKAIAGGDFEVNVFGFSRGSLSTIEFLNRIHENPKYKGVKVNFVVLWDNVKYASKKHRHNLPAGMKFNYAPLHLIALDEQRSQFYNEDVLDLGKKALQIGYRGVHADGGGFLYKDKVNVFGRETLADVRYMASLIGIKFDDATIDSFVDSSYFAGQYDAVPTDNDTVFYKDGTLRTFPKDMYLDNSVKRFSSPVRNPIGSHREITRRDIYRWAKRYYPDNWEEGDW